MDCIIDNNSLSIYTTCHNLFIICISIIYLLINVINLIII